MNKSASTICKNGIFAISKHLINTSKFLIDLLFPKFCVGCGEEGSWLCSRCQNDIIPVVSQVCPKCAKLSENGAYHLNCRKDVVLKGVIAASYFEEGPIREMIHNFKYNGVTELAKPLGNLMVKSFDLSCLSNLSHLILTFVPLHWRRQAQRGYNQAEILAKEVASLTGLKAIGLLKKRKPTKRQAELGVESRHKNLQGAFVLKRPISLKGKTIILIDDVTTTGSTLNECARVLKSAGAKEVWGLVVCRG